MSEWSDRNVTYSSQGRYFVQFLHGDDQWETQEVRMLQDQDKSKRGVQTNSGQGNKTYNINVSFISKSRDEWEKTEETHMQTDCPTEDVRDRQMKGKRNGRMRWWDDRAKDDWVRGEKKSYLTQGTQNLPHLKAREKKQTDKDSEEVEEGKKTGEKQRKDS